MQWSIQDMSVQGITKNIIAYFNPLRSTTYAITLDHAKKSADEKWRYLARLWLGSPSEGEWNFWTMLIGFRWGFSDYASLGLLPLAAVIINLLIMPITIALFIGALLPTLLAAEFISWLKEEVSLARKSIWVISALLLAFIGIPGLLIAAVAFFFIFTPLALWLGAKILVSFVGATLTYPFKLLYDSISNWYAKPYVQELLVLETLASKDAAYAGRLQDAVNNGLIENLNFRYDDKKWTTGKPELIIGEEERERAVFRLLLTTDLNSCDKRRIYCALVSLMVLNPRIEERIASKFESYQGINAHKKTIPFTHDNFFKALNLTEDQSQPLFTIRSIESKTGKVNLIYSN